MSEQRPVSWKIMTHPKAGDGVQYIVPADYSGADPQMNDVAVLYNQSQETANLIIAAPGLLQACEEAAKRIWHDIPALGDDNQEAETVLQQIREMLFEAAAKARGEAALR